MIEVYRYVSTGLCFDIHNRGGDQETEGEKKIECWSEGMREKDLYIRWEGRNIFPSLDSFVFFPS